MKVKPLRHLVLCAGIVLLSGLLAGCNQNRQQKNTSQVELARGGHHGLRAACADDIQKYCANEQRPRRCLRDNMDKLSDTCKAALAQQRGHRNNGGGDNNGGNGDQD